MDKELKALEEEIVQEQDDLHGNPGPLLITRKRILGKTKIPEDSKEKLKETSERVKELYRYLHGLLPDSEITITVTPIYDYPVALFESADLREYQIIEEDPFEYLIYSLTKKASMADLDYVLDYRIGYLIKG